MWCVVAVYNITTHIINLPINGLCCYFWYQPSVVCSYPRGQGTIPTSTTGRWAIPILTVCHGAILALTWVLWRLWNPIYLIRNNRFELLTSTTFLIFILNKVHVPLLIEIRYLSFRLLRLLSSHHQSKYPRRVNFPDSLIYLLENFWVIKCAKIQTFKQTIILATKIFRMWKR